ncbi:MAG TPA: hypothetical protein VMT46_19440 [Anaerolineaceae bacterium]|nr:hypothetical protein [Anaerolineaceae bacterium]
MNRPDCPVYEQVRDLGNEIRRTLRRLRRSMRECRKCPIVEECSLRVDVQDLIRRAAEEALEELSG